MTTLSDIQAAKKTRIEEGAASGPVYNGIDGGTLRWFDQAFQKSITPSGTVNCAHPLMVGTNQNSLDIALIGNHANAATYIIPKDATITLTLSECDTDDGTFKATGPSICVTAPDGGISVDPDGLAFRFPLGNFKKPWIKAKLVFTGTYPSGLKLDCVLCYVPR